MQVPIKLTSNTAEGGISGNDLLINVFPRITAGGRSEYKLIHTPGLLKFAELPTYPVLALHIIANRLFAVTPSKLYEINTDGTNVEIGDVLFTNRVICANNGYQIVMVDGAKGYFYNINTAVLTEITDPAFYPASHVTFQDGYFIFNRAGTGQFYLSALLDVAFDGNDYATAEGQPDNIVGVISDHRELFMFGQKTIEVWYNSGAVDFPLERNQGAFIEKGCAAPYSIAKQDNTLYFVGNDLLVYQMVGYTPLRVSSHAVEATLSGAVLTDIFAYTYAEDGHMFYVLTIISKNITWCFDVSTKSWHQRQSHLTGRHRTNNGVVFNDKNIVGDFEDGRIYHMMSQYYTDDGDPITREFILPDVSNGREIITIDSLELDMGRGVGLVTGQGSDPEVMITCSKDNGHDYGNITKFAKIGKIGAYLGRVKVNRFGSARQFTFKIKISDPIPIEIGNVFVEIRQ